MSLKSPWNSIHFNLHPNLILYLEQIFPQGPELLEEHLLVGLDQVHHLELYLPSAGRSTITLIAGLLSIASRLLLSLDPKQDDLLLLLLNKGQKKTLQPILMLMLCLSPLGAQDAGSYFSALGDEQDLPALKPYATHDTHSLSDDLEALSKKKSVDRPNILISTLSRADLLRDLDALLIDSRLAVLTLDLRPCSSFSSASSSPSSSSFISHHAIAQIKSWLLILHPHTQLIVLFPSSPTSHPHHFIPSSLLALLNTAIDRSIRTNLLSSSSTSFGHPNQQDEASCIITTTPFLSSSSEDLFAHSSPSLTTTNLITSTSSQSPSLPPSSPSPPHHASATTTTTTSGLGLIKLTPPTISPAQLEQRDQLYKFHHHPQKHSTRQERDDLQWSDIIEKFERAGLKPTDFTALC